MAQTSTTHYDGLASTPDLLSPPFNGIPCVEVNNSCLELNDSLVYDYTSIDPELQFYHVLWTIVSPILFAVIIVIGTLGNLLVIYVILSRVAMRTATNYLLLNLALSDVAFLVICVPITAYKFAATTWPFGDTTCKVINYIIYVTVYVTVYTLVAVSFLRYITVVHSATSVRYRTKQCIIICNILIWVLILLVNIPTLLTNKLQVWNEHYSYCGMHDNTPKPFFLTFFLFGYAVPLAIICILYIILIHHLNLASVSTIGQTRQRAVRASKVIVLVVTVFAILWLPMHVNQLHSAFWKVPEGKLYEVYRVLSQCFAYGNSCANPIIYNLVSKEFKKNFYEVICGRKSGSVRYRNGTINTQDGLAITAERTAMV